MTMILKFAQIEDMDRVKISFLNFRNTSCVPKIKFRNTSCVTELSNLISVTTAKSELKLSHNPVYVFNVQAQSGDLVGRVSTSGASRKS